LRREGYEHSPADPCVMRWIVSEKVFLLLIYVEGTATIDMTYFIEKLLESYKNLVARPTPSNKSIFQVSEDAVALREEDRKVFHSVVAKLLYLSKRARPDILTAVSFLCTRVTRATVEDQKKLEYLLGYLQATKEEVLWLTPLGVLGVEAYVDAAFAPHADSKSHTGVAIFIGGALVFAAS
jgi:hypothetical protein